LVKKNISIDTTFKYIHLAGNYIQAVIYRWTRWKQKTPLGA
jgi:hypothetical protein